MVWRLRRERCVENVNIIITIEFMVKKRLNLQINKVTFYVKLDEAEKCI